MKLADELCKSAISNMINAFSYHRIILNKDGIPCDFEFIEVNKAFENMTGISRDMVIGKSILQTSSEITDDQFNWIAFYGNIALNMTSGYTEQYSEALGRWLQVNAYSPEKGYFVTIFNDITALKQKEKELEQQAYHINNLYEEQTALFEEVTASEEELRLQLEELNKTNRRLLEAERRLNKAQALAHVGNWEIDLRTRELWASEEAFRIYELKSYTPILPLEIVQKMVHPDDRLKMDLALKNLIENKTPYEVEFRINTEDNAKERYIHSKAELGYDQAGKVVSVLGVLQDITDRIKYQTELKIKNEELSSMYEEIVASEEELKENYIKLGEYVEKLENQQRLVEHLAYYDSLTDLPNRILFLDRLNIALNLSERSGKKSAVVFLDIDNFKDVNDSLGHSIGDKLLKAVGQRLSVQVRNYETLARLGGDEFAVLLQNIEHQNEAYEFCERLKNEFNSPFDIEGYTFNINASMGITFYPLDGLTAEELLRNADTAMYRAKFAGKNNIQFFQQDMKDEMYRRLLIEQGLRRSLITGSFSLHYQPQIELSSGRIRSFEALLRWSDNELGNLSPTEYISIAEDTGLIIPLGEWVLREACSQGALWNERFCKDLLLSVNISAVQLKQCNFVNMVKQILDETGFPPDHLELEITESLLINSFEKTSSMLRELRNLGIKVSLDDFGTGYSSLNYLKQLPINTLKIDKTFIHDINTDSVEKEITGFIVSLMHKLQIEVVAEGVETKKQMDYLISCNCDNVQGFLLSKPIPPTEVPAIIEKNYLDLIQSM